MGAGTRARDCGRLVLGDPRRHQRLDVVRVQIGSKTPRAAAGQQHGLRVGEAVELGERLDGGVDDAPTAQYHEITRSRGGDSPGTPSPPTQLYFTGAVAEGVSDNCGITMARVEFV